MITFFKILKILLCIIGAVLALVAGYVLVLWLLSLSVDINRPLVKQHKIFRDGMANIAVIACSFFGVKIHLTGLEKIPESGRFVMVSNHRSGFDPLCVMVALRKYNISFISKPSNIKLPVVGRIGYAAGCLPIDRENDRNALKTILTAADYIKKDFCSMLIYPEGTRSKTLELLPFHAGSFKLAQKAGVPVVVALSQGTENVTKNFFRRPKDIYIDILSVIPAEQVKAMKTAELSEIARNIICAKLS